MQAPFFDALFHLPAPRPRISVSFLFSMENYVIIKLGIFSAANLSLWKENEPMRKSLALLLTSLFTAGALTGCSQTETPPAESQSQNPPPIQSSPGTSLQETEGTGETTPYFTSDAITLAGVEYHLGDRISSLVDAGWVMVDEEYELSQTVKDADLVYVNLKLAHPDYSGTTLHVSVNFLENQPDDLFADGYLEVMNLSNDIYAEKVELISWTVGGVLTDTQTLDEVLALFEGAQAVDEVTGYTMKVELGDYLSSSAFDMMKLEWDLDKLMFHAVFVRFDLDILFYS